MLFNFALIGDQSLYCVGGEREIPKLIFRETQISQFYRHIEYRTVFSGLIFTELLE